GAVVGHPHQRRDPGERGDGDHPGGGLDRQRRVLEVDDDEVEARERGDLRRLDRGDLQPRPHRGLSGRGPAGQGQQRAHDRASGAGYSLALSTHPGRAEKSVRGPEKMSISWLRPLPTASVVWMVGGGMIVTDGLPTVTWSSSRHWAAST